MRLPEPVAVGRPVGGDAYGLGSPVQFPTSIPAWTRNVWAHLRESSQTTAPGRSKTGHECLAQLLGWLAPATVACLLLAAAAGATFGDRPPVLATAVLVVALGYLVLLWRSAVWLLGCLDDPAAGPAEFRAALANVREKEQELRSLAYRDSLTRLPNRSLFYDRLGLAIRHSSRERSRLAILFLDLDGFKAVNDSQGHLFGDRLLVAVGERINASVRAVDTVARFGGDEFLVLLPRVAEAADADSVASKILDALRLPFRIDATEVMIGASVGASLFPDDGRTPEELVNKADRAMYLAKEATRQPTIAAANGRAQLQPR